MPTPHKLVLVTIANSGTASTAADLRGWALRGIHMPADWDTADITFTSCETETGTFDPVYYSTGEAATAIAAVTIKTPVADRYIPLTSHAAVAMVSPGWVKVVASAAQTPARSIYLEVIEA